MDMYNDVKIQIKIKDVKTLLANATVSVNTIAFGFVTIKGFAIWRSSHFNSRLQEAINITPPSKPAYGKHYPIIFLENKDKWYELELMIYGAFSLKRNEGANEELTNKDIDEISEGINK